MNKADILILGAGCAGTFLAHFLEYLGYDGKIVLLDMRTKFDREQRWCGWAKLPDFLEPTIRKTWKNWTVCDENLTVTRNSDEYIYQEIYAPQFFAYFHSKWQNSESNIELQLGEKVVEVIENADFVEIQTETQSWQANLVFDARNEGSKNLENIKSKNEISLKQLFVGLEIEFDEAVFDTENAVLMDFRTSQFDGLNFIYVLPYSEKKALIESTSFTINSFDKTKHRQAIIDYSNKHFGENFKLISEEIGLLPMTTTKFPVQKSKRIYSIGVAGGSARPSSAYAFHRILRQTAKIAEAIINNQNLPLAVAPSKYDLLDAVLLEAIERNPEIARDYFVTMFDKVKPESLIRFMLDESSVFDDYGVMKTSPKLRFAMFTLQSLKRNFL